MKLILALIAALAAPLASAHGDNHAGEPAAVAEQTKWGIAGSVATRTVTVDLLDSMRFSPDRIEVAEGETIRFVIHNRGRMLHEMVIGTPSEIAEHAALMARFPNMEHDSPYMAHVAPGKQGEIVWTFNRAGEFEYACLLAGHYAAGMRGRILVQAGTDAGAPSADGGQPASEGVVRKIDPDAGKLTLRHGRIDNLDMPPMTMVFRVQPRELLNAVKAGDKVKFYAEERNGELVVTAIQVLP
jgi:uncharacterized cupredoxin-like copper-binding protein/Cu/Ag efflux protein CusF